MKVLRSSRAEWEARGVTILGVSSDPVGKQRAFCDRYRLPFDLLADPEKRVIDAFGVETDPRTGRAKRETFVFRRGRMVWHDPDVTPLQQAFDIRKVIAQIEEAERERVSGVGVQVSGKGVSILKFQVGLLDTHITTPVLQPPLLKPETTIRGGRLARRSR